MKARPVRGSVSRTKILVRTALAATAAGALSWVALAGGSSGATVTAAPVADEAPGYAVEDFSYPGADQILAERNITLKRGDGHIVLAECVSGTGQLEVTPRVAAGAAPKICFQVTGDSGWLTLEIPQVFGMKSSEDYSTQVELTSGTDEQSLAIPKNSYAGVGESVDPDGRDFTLVEIRTSK
ncbi:hypothetical protein OHT52_10855 [Streptomyces sp. NBC_00247]|uniref:hypothetical protein n=1 Tax=Streptomyces sp. NBC_00247 TaxID=2975689 RepID=UPI002E2A78E5|nr:hypothetical protein [Streptomyces sp. NBC_00247]